MKKKTSPTPAPASAPECTSKIARVIVLLQHEDGATLAQMAEATGWQPHIARLVR